MDVTAKSAILLWGLGIFQSFQTLDFPTVFCSQFPRIVTAVVRKVLPCIAFESAVQSLCNFSVSLGMLVTASHLDVFVVSLNYRSQDAAWHRSSVLGEC